ncbi:MAG: CoA-binding protein [Ignavibacteriales bacterium CG07_land_8_20_14_0_80_59_12]|nr:MAG: CoA-binding protein [Ignavibacteriales bacterium CG07_land_8_20_14_0_80_59_12]
MEVTTCAAVDDFLSRRTLAVAGVSRNRAKFGNAAYRALKSKGYKVFSVNPNAEQVEGDACYPDLRSLPEPVEGVVLAVPPSTTEHLVREAADAGITSVWIQQGAESEAALRICKERAISVVSGECILMFAEPAEFYHRAHRWVKGILGKAPK